MSFKQRVAIIVVKGAPRRKEQRSAHVGSRLGEGAARLSRRGLLSLWRKAPGAQGEAFLNPGTVLVSFSYFF